jgi:hypothetical protein
MLTKQMYKTDSKTVIIEEHKQTKQTLKKKKNHSPFELDAHHVHSWLNEAENKI